MAGTQSIGGLASGLDTATLVNQLMQLEAVSQTKLKNQVVTKNTVIDELQAANTRVAALATQAQELAKADTWNALRTTSSLAGVTVAATSDAAATSFQVKVNTVATTSGIALTQTAGIDDVLVPVDPATGTRTLTVTHASGESVTVDTGDGTLRSIAAALNATDAGTGVRATTLQVSSGQYRLVVDSTATGAGSDFTLATSTGDLLGGPEAARTRVGTDASIEVAGFTLTSATNTFDDVMPGISITLAATTKAGETSEVAVTRDAGERVAAIKKLVDEINAITTAAGGATGALGRESSVRALRDAFYPVLYPADGSSMSEFGLEVDRTGKLTFDETKFSDAYAADPTKVAAAFGAGTDTFATRVATIAEQFSTPKTGVLSMAINAQESAIDSLNDSIAAWDNRLEVRRRTLERTYSALEVALSNLQSSGTYLTSQFASMNSSSNQ